MSLMSSVPFAVLMLQFTCLLSGLTLSLSFSIARLGLRTNGVPFGAETCLHPSRGFVKNGLSLRMSETAPTRAEPIDKMVVTDNWDFGEYIFQRKQRDGNTFEFVFPGQLEVSPLSPEESDKPLLLFLPGLDGSGWTAESQYKDLATKFELRVMQVFRTDRSNFDELVDGVASFIRDWQERSRCRAGKAILLGESFGGLLALGIAQQHPLLLHGLVLANPATSVLNSTTLPLAPFFLGVPEAVPMSTTPLPDFLKMFPDPLGILRSESRLPIPNATLGNVVYSAVGGPFLQISSSDEYVRQKLAETLRRRMEVLVRDAVEGGGPLQATLDLLEDSGKLMESLLSLLPPDTLRHRIDNCLLPGASQVLPRIPSVSLPTLIIAGEQDMFLPSNEESRRLSALLPNSKRVVCPGAGHAVLIDRFNVTALILDSPVAPPPFVLDAPVTDLDEPSPAKEVTEG